MDSLNSCGLKNCGWCRETGGDKGLIEMEGGREGTGEEEEGAGEDGGTGGGN